MPEDTNPHSLQATLTATGHQDHLQCPSQTVSVQHAAEQGPAVPTRQLCSAERYRAASQHRLSVYSDHWPVQVNST